MRPGEPEWTEFAPDVPRRRHPAFRPLPEPEPGRNTPALVVDLALIAIVLVVTIFALFGKLDWLLDLGNLLHR